ncbi:MAG: hypothetical protein ING66_10330 [Rhodocyclaceae bacterium]|nr:hypothetical protein [Rhodocyclaceae bacterium]MCA3061117.1 hypothetical protein [Rhodocyclaceae bacterium]MCA3084619.1 hypothetical protein [Rhodocyclaceae bacterium]
MANRNPSLKNLKPFAKGESGNPGGKPVGSRNRIQGEFLKALAEDFAEHGREAIIQCRLSKPDAYIKVVGALLPKEFEIKRPLEGLADEELESFVLFLRGQLPAKSAH